MQITWNTDVPAPCCPGEIVAADARTILIQTDYDYPGVASTFGWCTRNVQQDDDAHCDHSGTDGTIPCPECGLDASVFIANAREFLDDNDGLTVDDPGYFESPV